MQNHGIDFSKLTDEQLDAYDKDRLEKHQVRIVNAIQAILSGIESGSITVGSLEIGAKSRSTPTPWPDERSGIQTKVTFELLHVEQIPELHV